MNTKDNTTQSVLPDSLVNEALEAFWHVIVKHYPQAKTGDLSPLAWQRLHEAADDAIKEWVWANVPFPNNE